MYQKKYLLELLRKYEKRCVPSSLFVAYATANTRVSFSEPTTFVSIARIVFTVVVSPPSTKKAPKWKKVAMIIVVLSLVNFHAV